MKRLRTDANTPKHSSMKYFQWVLYASVFIGITADAQKYPRYQTWQDSTDRWIRVGLAKPAKVIELYSNGTLLVIDKDKVVGTVDPGGKFLIISPKKTRGQYWLQIQARSSKTALQKRQAKLAAKYPKLSFSTQRIRSKLWALRIGPYASRKEVNDLRPKMVAEGFGDAFLVRSGGTAKFQWVDGNFDKYDFRANNLALARLDPDQSIQYGGKEYRGRLRFRLEGSRIRVINELPLETYLRGVVPAEMGPRVFPELEALKAQAVAARTYAMKNMGQFGRKGYDICDGPACQAYGGKSAEDPLSDEAVKATEGLVLYHKGTLIDALYTSTCGGFTDDVENVFPGRKDPYLRSQSSYLAEYERWSIPHRKIAEGMRVPQYESLAIEALLYGYPAIPPLQGNLSGEMFGKALNAFSWILGKPGQKPSGDRISHRAFWENIANLPFILRVEKNQIHDADREKVLAPFKVPEKTRGLATFLLRHNLISAATLAEFSKPEPISVEQAFTHLIRFCKDFGPEPEWKRFRVEGVSQNSILVSRGIQNDEISLAGIQYYVTDTGKAWEFRETPVLEELDRVYTLKAPFPKHILRIEPTGVVASLDRFSPFDAWIEKKSVGDLEKRARRYVSGIRGIRDVQILKRSETGRVTLMKFIADSGVHKVDGLRIRWSLGVRDNLFDLLPSYKNGRLVHLTAVGRGWGHGVGMSQVGAYGLARMDWTFDQILAHYYTGVDIYPFTPAGTE